MTHVPKNRYCEVCKRAEMYKPPSYKVGGTRTIEAKSLGTRIQRLKNLDWPSS